MNPVKPLLSQNALPVDEALPALKAALASGRNAVLVAPPGAGKTTRVPLELLGEAWVAAGKILVLEPRRLAARAAAARMAQTLSEKVGDTVGLRIRLETKVSKKTRIEVLTEGVFTRALLDDPELKNVAAVLFDEFHERSLDADLGLALALDAQRGLREDLRILAMSATLDGAHVAKLLGAPVIESKGRAFPVETRYLGRDPRAPIDRQMSDAILRALADEDGSVLAFLPGAAEIRRTANLLAEKISDRTTHIVPLYGALDARTQDEAISPAPEGERKVVLATSIAETSLTIEGVRVVVDSGLSRVPRFEPSVGLTRLETVRVSRASADQRRGRAGRTESGVCYRLWSEPETQSLAPFATPEILAADLTNLVLDLAVWGVSDPASLPWLDPPPAAALSEARNLLIELGAVDESGRITETGKKLARFPLHPRLATMVVEAAAKDKALLAAEIAAVVSERGLGGDDVDLAHRIEQFRRDKSNRAGEARRLANNWAAEAGGKIHNSPATQAGALLALAYPDRVAKARTGKRGEFLLASGRGAAMDAANSLAKEPMLAVAEITGAASGGRILLAAKLSEKEFEAHFKSRISEGTEVAFDPAAMAVRARAVRRYGALILDEHPRKLEPNEETARALADGIARAGISRLPWTKSAEQWLARVRFMRGVEGEPWPDLSNKHLAATIGDWLAPYLIDKASLAEISGDILSTALHALLAPDLARRLNQETPTHVTAPPGSQFAIDYGSDEPAVSVRVQELFGTARHPMLGGKIPLTFHLLSPAHRPIQTTKNLPAFWQGSWAEVRRDMRGQYPKHPWPENPLEAPPTRRAKPRGT
ncbi:MAG TPA: ATP-dependent helicase HrpB [Xanthobacteraceae bacterium]|nr:ATP-dependent helicase HrpB [Xanthobacteraceae bacterium]